MFSSKIFHFFPELTGIINYQKLFGLLSEPSLFLIGKNNEAEFSLKVKAKFQSYKKLPSQNDVITA
jgi:hypothetical protein